MSLAFSPLSEFPASELELESASAEGGDESPLFPFVTGAGTTGCLSILSLAQTALVKERGEGRAGTEPVEGAGDDVLVDEVGVGAVVGVSMGAEVAEADAPVALDGGPFEDVFGRAKRGLGEEGHDVGGAVHSRPRLSVPQRRPNRLTNSVRRHS